MDGVVTFVPLKDIEHLDEIKWGPYDEHHADDPEPKTTQYYSKWHIGIRGEDIWQLRMALPRPVSTINHPWHAYARIVLSQWHPSFLEGRLSWVWAIGVYLTEEERELNEQGKLPVPISGRERHYESRSAVYYTIADRADHLYHSFMDSPYSLLAQLALGD